MLRSRLAQARREPREEDVVKLKVLKYLLLLLDFHAALKPGGKTVFRKLPLRDTLREKLGAEDFLVDTIRKRFATGRCVSVPLLLLPKRS